MFLMPCVECGHAISRQAPNCPRCGCPDPATPATAESPLEASAVRSAHDVAPPRTAGCWCTRCGQAMAQQARFCAGCGLFSSAGTAAGLPFAMPVQPPQAADAIDARMVERIAEYERVSAILWLIFGILQVITVVAIIAGVWNIFAALSRFKLAPLIRARDPCIPEVYEGITQLIVIGVINVFFGGVIGVLFVAFDFYVRSLVLQHRHLFAPPSAAMAA